MISTGFSPEVGDEQLSPVADSGLSAGQLLEAADRFATPLYVYNLTALEERFQTLRAVLPKRVGVHYALKANGSLAICNRLARLGCGADICSRGELLIAETAGFEAEQTLFTGPGKTDIELREAVERGIRWIVVESLGEARRINAIAEATGHRQSVLARISPHALPSGDGLVIARQGEKFGIDESVAVSQLTEMAELSSLSLEGIHVYAESCVVDADRLLAINRQTLGLGLKMARLGLPISVIDFGGGLGVNYSTNGQEFDLARYGRGLRDLVDLAPSHWSFLIEPGRFLSAAYGVYVVRVVDVKSTSRKRHVIVDGGIHQLYRPNLPSANRLVRVLGSEGPRREVTLGGPLLSGEDVLAKDIALPPIEVGSRLAFSACGAYSYSHCLAAFSAHPRPAEVAIEGNELWLMRRRGRPSEALRGQNANPPSFINSTVEAVVTGGSER